MKVLLTGGTGFLGKHVQRVLKKANIEFTLLSRSSTTGIQADLTQWDAGIEASKLKNQFDAIIHLAGLYDLRASELETSKTNVMGTHNALVLAQKAEIPVFINASTVAVTIGANGFAVSPYELSTSRKFPDPYSYSKGNAEHMVQFWTGPNPMSRVNLRLGVLVGSTTGEAIERIDGPYHAFMAVKKLAKWIHHFPGSLPLPGNETTRLPVVPVDVAAQAIVTMLQKNFELKWTDYKSFHIAPKECLSAKTLYRSAFDYSGLNRKTFTLVDKAPDNVVKALAEQLAHLPAAEIEYLLNIPRLSVSETNQVLGPNWCPEFEEYEKAFWQGLEAYVQNS